MDLMKKNKIKNAYMQNGLLFEALYEFKYALIKGEALSIGAYGKTGERVSNDIDILIPRKSLTEIEQLFEHYGFKSTIQSREDKILMLSASHQISPVIKDVPPYGTLSIDINFDVFWGEYQGKRIDIEDFLSDFVEVNIYGCKIKTLNLLKSMVQLILHHYKEMNSIYHLAGHNCIKYSMFKDVYFLWKNNEDEISLEELYHVSSRYEIIPYVYYILYYTNMIFNDDRLKVYIDKFETKEGVELLECYGLNENERKYWKVDFQTRLNTEDLYGLIKNDLTQADIEKLERNCRIFG